MKNTILIINLFLLSLFCNAQTIDKSVLTKQWKAFWVSVPAESATDYGVYRFRKMITLTEKPESYVVHVSADNRYKLFVNGQLVSLGPARGDLNHWNFETVDIAHYLRIGKNVIASIVWNEGKLKALAQISNVTGFILQGNTAKEYELNTNSGWQCIRDLSYLPIEQRPPGYYAAGSGEFVNMNMADTDWMNPDYDTQNWKKAQNVAIGIPWKTFNMMNSPWQLVQSTIPQMELTPQRILKTRIAKGISVPSTYPATKTNITIPANSNVSLLLDQTFLTNAYPVILYSKGKNASISMRYAEGLYDEQIEKGNRNKIEGKTLIGRNDSIICNGQDNQMFTTLMWRTYRYLQLNIHTSKEPLILNDIYGVFTGYPFINNTTFVTDRPLLDSILQIGWRTARLCAGETYMDCPFYEQLQYVGDTRIQGVISYYNSGDDRLAKNAITLIDNSRFPEGFTQSRYPTNLDHIIPPFSLHWIGMVHDYFKYRSDMDFVKSKLPGTRQVLSFFASYQQVNGLLKDTPFWNFTDWAEGDPRSWKFGTPPLGKNGTSSVIDLQLLWAYQEAAELENAVGLKALSDDYLQKAELMKQSIIKTYWNSEKKLFADRAEHDSYSQHANILAILTGVVTGEDAKNLYKQMMGSVDLAKASIYFQYYRNQALVKAGLGNDYLNQMDIWKKNIQMGLTTWGEDSNVERTRSDCHAWGASPNIEFFRTVLGIDSDAPGFAKVKIEPHLGDLKKISGSMPHPKGNIAVSYTCNKKNQWKIIISLPADLPGVFVWGGKSYTLQTGENQINI